MVAILFATSPFDDDSDDDAEAFSRRPVVSRQGSDKSADCSIGGSGLRVVHLDCGRDWRGGQAQVLMLMKGLARRGVTNLMLAPSGPLLDRARDLGFECERWSPKGDWDLGAMVRAAQRLKSMRPDVVHCHDAKSHATGVPAARMAGVKAVVVSRRVAFPVASNPLSALKYRMPVDRYLCVSRAVIERLRTAGVRETRLALVPDAFELVSGPRAIDLRQLIGVPSDAPLVTTVAALTPEKGHADLLKAAARVVDQMPATHFVWLGEGRCRESLLCQRAQLGLDARVHLLGHRPDAQQLLSQSTVCALASTEEGLGTALIEALALGVPVVATAVGGVPEVIRNGQTGRLVPPRNQEALAAALIEALSSPSLRRAWSEAGRLSVQGFDVDCMAECTIDEYTSILRA
jgi:glycosyltransferase involved in cell wall biosynthesis